MLARWVQVVVIERGGIVVELQGRMGAVGAGRGGACVGGVVLGRGRATIWWWCAVRVWRSVGVHTPAQAGPVSARSRHSVPALHQPSQSSRVVASLTISGPREHLRRSASRRRRHTAATRCRVPLSLSLCRRPAHPHSFELGRRCPVQKFGNLVSKNFWSELR